MPRQLSHALLRPGNGLVIHPGVFQSHAALMSVIIPPHLRFVLGVATLQIWKRCRTLYRTAPHTCCDSCLHLRDRSILRPFSVIVSPMYGHDEVRDGRKGKCMHRTEQVTLDGLLPLLCLGSLLPCRLHAQTPWVDDHVHQKSLRIYYAQSCIVERSVKF